MASQYRGQLSVSAARVIDAASLESCFGCASGRERTRGADFKIFPYQEPSTYCDFTSAKIRARYRDASTGPLFDARGQRIVGTHAIFAIVGGADGHEPRRIITMPELRETRRATS